jgi:hypothetical protein
MQPLLAIAAMFGSFDANRASRCISGIPQRAAADYSAAMDCHGHMPLIERQSCDLARPREAARGRALRTLVMSGL